MTGDQDFDDILQKCVGILSVKGPDYQAGSTDRLANFAEVARFVGVTPGQVLATYLYKHVAAVFRYIQVGGQSESEPIEGRLADIINYCLLLGKMVREGRVGIPAPQGRPAPDFGDLQVDSERLAALQRAKDAADAAHKAKWDGVERLPKTPAEWGEVLRQVAAGVPLEDVTVVAEDQSAHARDLATHQMWADVLAAEGLEDEEPPRILEGGGPGDHADPTAP